MDFNGESVVALDATAFYQGFHLYSEKTCITTDLIFAEISHIHNKLSILESLILNRKLMVFEPRNNTIRLVKAAAKQIGEDRLTDADISILALAKDYDAILVSDDFAICNLAKTMLIKLLNIGTKGINQTRKWIKFCKICGKGYSPKQANCAICGNKLRIRFKKSIIQEINSGQC